MGHLITCIPSTSSVYFCDLYLHVTQSKGGDSLIKVGTDVQQVQKLGRAKFFQKNLMPGQKVPKNLMTWQVFINFFMSVKIGTFQQVLGHFFHSTIKYYTFLSKITKNLMLGQNLPPKT